MFSNFLLFSSVKRLPFGTVTVTLSSPILRKGVETISLTTFIRVPFKLKSLFFAYSPRVVAMQVPSAVATKSVGEKNSPFPPLSTGASVLRTLPEDVCFTVQ